MDSEAFGKSKQYVPTIAFQKILHIFPIWALNSSSIKQSDQNVFCFTFIPCRLTAQYIDRQSWREIA